MCDKDKKRWGRRLAGEGLLTMSLVPVRDWKSSSLFPKKGGYIVPNFRSLLRSQDFIALQRTVIKEIMA